MAQLLRVRRATNHCPACLWSRHLDKNAPGDRDSTCAAGMEPVAVTVRGEGRWVLIHRCLDCGRLRMNKTALDDNPLVLLQLATAPLATPPTYLAGVGSVSRPRPSRRAR